MATGAADLDTDAVQVLRRAEDNLRGRRQSAVDELTIALDWAAINGHLDTEVPGGPKLVELGGEGTPRIVDVSLGELAIARQSTVGATRNLTADALDLVHRLPLTWRVIQELDIDVWVGRKIARQSRALSKDQAAIVDRAVAGARHDSPGRILTLAEAKILEAAPDIHTEQVESMEARQGVWIEVPRDIDGEPAEPGHRHVFARISTADAIWLDATLDRVADLLAHRPEHAGKDRNQLRAAALALYGRPGELAALLGTGCDTEALRPDATVYVHLTPAHFGNDNLVARVEAMGPILVKGLEQLVGHTRISLKPVIDLNAAVSHNAYEHPESLKERSRLRMVHDAFPHSASMGRQVDHDHVEPFVHDPDTGPGQTGDLNTQPLTRHHHRIKTHAGMSVRQIGIATFVWSTPHGLHRIVSPNGTVECDPGMVEIEWAS